MISSARVVVAGAYVGVGATLEQVRRIFATHHLPLVLLADFEHMPLPFLDKSPAT
jgi:hypothetical protein